MANISMYDRAAALKIVSSLSEAQSLQDHPSQIES